MLLAFLYGGLKAMFRVTVTCRAIRLYHLWGAVPPTKPRPLRLLLHHLRTAVGAVVISVVEYIDFHSA